MYRVTAAWRKRQRQRKNLDTDVAKELEKALDFDLMNTAERDLDITASMEDLEAQISQAADELARESRNGNGPEAAQPKPENGKTKPELRTTFAYGPSAG